MHVPATILHTVTSPLLSSSLSPQLKQCEEDLRRLEREVEDAGQPSRLRLLGGKEPLQDSLRGKLEQLEEQMMKQEQQQLERELLYEQVCKLTDRAQTKVETHKDSTLQVPNTTTCPALYADRLPLPHQVAQRVNHYQNKIKEVTRKTMALVSELTMKQVCSVHLHFGHPINPSLNILINATPFVFPVGCCTASPARGAAKRGHS